MTNNFSKTKPSDIPDMLKLKRNGWTLEAIGKKYKIHHATVYWHLKKLGQDYPRNKVGVKKIKRTLKEKIEHDRLYYREWYKKNGRKRTDVVKNCIKKWRDNHPKEILAHSEFHRAIYSGKIIKPLKCSLCGSETKLVGHHFDYNKPLEVIWLCYSCHRIIHNKIKIHK